MSIGWLIRTFTRVKMLALILQLAVVVSPDTARIAPVAGSPAVVAAGQARPRAIEVSEWYHRRLVVHKTLSYAMLPVFASQYVAGSKLYDQGAGGAVAPAWARPVHRIGAATIAGIFGVNTVTGLWNLWDSRQVEDKRWLRVSHALAMLGADAAFAYTGLKLANEAENSFEKRREHRRVAVYAIGVSVGSGAVMKIFNDR